MAKRRSYSDEQLLRVVKDSHSWRGVLRELGLIATSSNAMRSVRSRADQIGADYSHFGRQWLRSEEELRQVLAMAKDWSHVVELLNLRDHAALSTVKGHAARFGLEVSHLNAAGPARVNDHSEPQLPQLRRAGPMLAAAWYTLCGHDISWPLEPCRYDLVVDKDGELQRVQVKTTTARAGQTWKVYLSTSRGGRTNYEPAEMDYYFVIDGDLNYYIIPFEAVGGLHAIHLSNYMRFQVAQLV